MTDSQSEYVSLIALSAERSAISVRQSKPTGLSCVLDSGVIHLMS